MITCASATALTVSFGYLRKLHFFDICSDNRGFVYRRLGNRVSTEMHNIRFKHSAINPGIEFLFHQHSQVYVYDNI